MGVLNGGYGDAAWRGTTPYHAEIDRMGVCFDQPDGQVMRLAISRESARHLAESLLAYLAADGDQAGAAKVVNGFDLDSAMAEYINVRGGAAGLLRSAPISELVAEEVGERFSCGGAAGEGKPAEADVAASDAPIGINCADCVHVLSMAAVKLCQAPQLAELVDGDTDLTLSQCARSFRHACGDAARWFVKREGIHYSYYCDCWKDSGQGCAGPKWQLRLPVQSSGASQEYPVA